ncbi:hypothetical protein F0562_014365 [Nyssa sinensis]|uniref:Uncharacterized protein n=1 Tax=Nyssa sinensis TaxID=561372 RepID=A0A5J4ZQ51_9ASTE|nr:hypothetical protein F0562_014365 [Nyssa sinensis]
MATLQASNMLCSSVSSSNCCQREIIRATINMPKLRTTGLSLPTLPTRVEEELDFRSGYIATQIDKHSNSPININFPTRKDTNVADPIVIAKLYAIMEAVADRVEMHKSIGEQRNNWNSLLLTSVNTITLTAATMDGIAATTANSTFPLAEEQRNAARLFKQLHGQIQTTIKIGTPTVADMKEFMNKVLALDKAYPLPLLGAMLDKFPSSVEPAVWWPQQPKRQEKELNGRISTNVLGCVAGALASVVNTFEHGGQVGMVFEMYRSNASFFSLVEESIESNLKERDVERRENGELFEMKVGLLLGRSLLELKDLAASSSSRKGEAIKEFASKLF